MSELRFRVVESAFHAKAKEVTVPAERPSEYFGKYVFSREKMFKYLPSTVYARLVDAMDHGAALDRSVADEVVLGRRVDEALKARAWEALEAFDLVDLADRHPASLSGGQKQRVTLAAAYCSDADLIVLDEPTSGLDGRGVREVSAWCRTLAAGGKAVAIITHDNLLAALAGDAVVELKG